MSVGSGATSLSLSADTRVPFVHISTGWYAAFIDICPLVSAYDNDTKTETPVHFPPLSALAQDFRM